MWTLTEEIKEWFDDNFSKVKFYDYILWKNYLSVLGIMSSIVTLISFFITVQDMEFDIKLVGHIGVRPCEVPIK